MDRPTTGKLFYLRLPVPGMDIYELRMRLNKHGAPELTIRLSVTT